MPSPGKIIDVLRERIDRWFPRVESFERTRADLAEFYATRTDYHTMTACEDKPDHPQVRALLGQLQSTDVTVEFGCGGGVVLAAVGKKVTACVGLDISPLALAKARRRFDCDCRCLLAETDIHQSPLRSGFADVVYSFEVLEHVWDPEAVILEMIRVLKPGGTLFFSTPNGLSLDLHLRKKPLLELLDHLGAASVWLRSLFRQRIFWNMEPNLQCTHAYPDCDMISTVFPRSLRTFLAKNNCAVDRVETFFFQREKAVEKSRKERFQQFELHPFYRHFGDHILVVAHKRC